MRFAKSERINVRSGFELIKYLDLFGNEYMLHLNNKDQKKVRIYSASLLTVLLIFVPLYVGYFRIQSMVNNYEVLAINDFPHTRLQKDMQGEYTFPSQANDTKETEDFFMAFAMSEYDGGKGERFDDPGIVSIKAYYSQWDPSSSQVTPLNLRPCTK
jgi:hypothetical protein